ncbi:hypothetical protein BDZ91DRAFT_718265 [Kalaharituber pfeilii]|nr:hypothetical protein BDZ91DRAFT_718265 [Kalaharituber pfeilii]
MMSHVSDLVVFCFCIFVLSSFFLSFFPSFFILIFLAFVLGCLRENGEWCRRIFEICVWKVSFTCQCGQLF